MILQWDLALGKDSHLCKQEEMLSDAAMSSGTQSGQGPREIFDFFHHVVHIVTEDRTRVYTLTTLRSICFPI